MIDVNEANRLSYHRHREERVTKMRERAVRIAELCEKYPTTDSAPKELKEEVAAAHEARERKKTAARKYRDSDGGKEKSHLAYLKQKDSGKRDVYAQNRIEKAGGIEAWREKEKEYMNVWRSSSENLAKQAKWGREWRASPEGQAWQKQDYERKRQDPEWVAKEAERGKVYHATHTVERAAYAKERYARPEVKLRTRELGLIRRYDMTLEEFDALMTKQGGVCALDKTAFDWESRTLYPCVDHEPNTEPKRIRGILHDECNRMLGLMESKLEFQTEVVKAYLAGA